MDRLFHQAGKIHVVDRIGLHREAPLEAPLPLEHRQQHLGAAQPHLLDELPGDHVFVRRRAFGDQLPELALPGVGFLAEDPRTMVGLVVAPTAPLPMAYSSSRGEQESFQTSVGLSCTVRYKGDALGDEMFTAVLSFIVRAGFPGLSPRPLQLLARTFHY